MHPTNISQWTTPHADHAMSSLDQAVIKAYAKGGRTSSPPAMAGGTGILPPSRSEGLGQAELPPETIPSEPSPSVPTNPSPLPPQIAPLNIAIDAIQSIDIRGDWDHEAAVSPMVLVADVQPNDAPSLL